MKNAPDRNILSAKDESHTKMYDTIRGATLIHGTNRALSEIPTYPRQLTYANTLQNTQNHMDSFDCTLSGPFDNLFLT